MLVASSGLGPLEPIRAWSLTVNTQSNAGQPGKPGQANQPNQQPKPAAPNTAPTKGVPAGKPVVVPQKPAGK
jgi:hypothetical protein